ncbi:MAG TPA: YdeI/OmpD-associated family protein, partial [Polyangiaceae bacterium]|nr:YdeI/OmpD-associated family protein [Polyangiaceae bacterium]
APAFKALIRSAVAANAAARTAARRRPGKASAPAARVEIAIPPDLAEALDDERMRPAWDSLPPGLRAYLLKRIDEAVHEATRTKRIAAAVEEALARHEKRVDRRPRGAG